MSRRTISVFCTDRGVEGPRHTKTDIDVLIVENGRVSEQRHRTERGAWQKGSKTEEGTSIADHTLTEGPSSRDDYDGREKWRFTCPRCGRAPQVTGDQMEQIVQLGVSGLDISLVQ